MHTTSDIVQKCVYIHLDCHDVQNLRLGFAVTYTSYMETIITYSTSCGTSLQLKCWQVIKFKLYIFLVDIHKICEICALQNFFLEHFSVNRLGLHMLRFRLCIALKIPLPKALGLKNQLWNTNKFKTHLPMIDVNDESSLSAFFFFVN